MDHQTGSGRNFFIHLAGDTDGAHQDFVKKLKDAGHVETFSPEDSDYLLLFCPVVSCVGTDIKQALSSISVVKPTVLVVMHHTFNPNSVVADSSRQVNDPNVYLTIDCLFHQGKLLRCNRNDIAWYEMQQCFGVSSSQGCVAFRVSRWNSGTNWCCDNLKVVCMGVCFVIALIVVIGTFAAIPRNHV